jgi:hypothetical protein
MGWFELKNIPRSLTLAFKPTTYQVGQLVCCGILFQKQHSTYYPLEPAGKLASSMSHTVSYQKSGSDMSQAGTMKSDLKELFGRPKQESEEQTWEDRGVDLFVPPHRIHSHRDSPYFALCIRER